MSAPREGTAIPIRPRKTTTAIETVIGKFVRGAAGLADLHPDDTVQRITIIRSRLPAAALEVIATDMELPKETVYEMLGIARATAARQVRNRQPLSAEATERAVFIGGLVKMVEDMLPEGRAQATAFDASKWVAQWLESPLPALAGQPPKAYLDTADGRVIVHRMLRAYATGAYV